MAKKKIKSADEIAQLDQIYTSLTGRDPNAPKKRAPKALVWICVSLLAVFVSIAALVCFGSVFDSFLPMGSSIVAGVDVTGMTKEQAKAAVAQAVDGTYTETPMEIQVQDTIVTLYPEDTGACLNVGAAVNAAFVFGRSGGVFDIYPYLGLNEDAVQQAINTLTAQYNTTLQQASWEVGGQAPETVTPENAGSQWLKITLGVPGYGIAAEEIQRALRSAYNANSFHAEPLCGVVQPEMPDLESIFQAHCLAPADAVMDEKTYAITPEESGYGFDMEAVTMALANCEHGQTLTFPFQILEPKVTAESINAGLFSQVLGFCKTPYSGSDNNSRNTNLRLACEAINGKIVYPGEIFTYNYTLGERTAARGYKPAPSYVNGKTVNTYGGGICQVSTTLYYCTLLADLEIVERWPHGYVPAYITWGTDASVSWNSGDFRFKNNTSHPIRIEAYREKGYVYVQLLGIDEKDYYVKLESITLSSTPYKTVYEEYAPDNKEGYKDGQVLVDPYTGYKVHTYKLKYNKADDTLISRERESVNNYSKRDKVVVKIVDPNAPAEGEELPEDSTSTETTSAVVPDDPNAVG